MKMNKVIGLFCSYFLLACGGGNSGLSAVAQLQADGNTLSSEVRNQVEHSEQELAALPARLREACGGAEIEIHVDYAGFVGTGFEGHSISGYCGEPAEVLIDWCSRPNVKRYVAENIEEIHCSYQQEEGATISVEDDVVRWSINWNASNHDVKARTGLLANL